MGGYGSGRYGVGGVIPKYTVEDCLCLDIKKLSRARILTPGLLTIWQWSNERYDGSKDTIKILTMSYGIKLYYAIKNNMTGDEKFMDYIVYLTWTNCNYGGRRPWFLCPKCNRRVAILYSKNYFFLCRYCHDLTYASCQESGDRYKELRRKIFKILNILREDETSYMALVPPKPKGLHWKTYNRLENKLLRLEHEMIQHLIRSRI